MPVNPLYTETFDEGIFLHLILKSVGNLSLFKKDDNRLYFLKKFAFYTTGYLKIYSYILLNNHVHFLIKCCENHELASHLNNTTHTILKNHQKQFLKNKISFQEAMELQFKDFLISYAMAYNKQENRTGTLFLKPSKKIKIKDDAHLTQTIVYIHANAVKHGLMKHIKNYKWSSYQTILSDKATLLQREEVLEWFGGLKEFVKVHKEQSAFFYSTRD